MKALATLLLTLMLLTLCPALLAVAGGDGYPAKEPDIPDAQELIDACWAISHETRGMGTTSMLLEGTLVAVRCLMEEIHKNATILISEDSFSSEQILESLEGIIFSYGKLYWHIYNSVESCTPACGSVHKLNSAYALFELYGDILKDIIEQRKEYGHVADLSAPIRTGFAFDPHIC